MSAYSVDAQKEAVGLWLSSCCDKVCPVTQAGYLVKIETKELYGSWLAYCARVDIEPCTLAVFSRCLALLGIRRKRTNKTPSAFIGLVLRADSEQPSTDQP